MTGRPPLSEGLDPPLYNNIATTHLCLQSLACLVVLVEGKFYDISSLKIFDELCASLADETEYKLSDNLVQEWLSVV